MMIRSTICCDYLQAMERKGGSSADRDGGYRERERKRKRRSSPHHPHGFDFDCEEPEMKKKRKRYCHLHPSPSPPPPVSHHHGDCDWEPESRGDHRRGRGRGRDDCERRARYHQRRRRSTSPLPRSSVTPDNPSRNRSIRRSISPPRPSLAKNKNAKIKNRRSPSPPATPRTILCYQLLCHIGNGAYGTVYRAADKSSGELVAIKRLQMDQQRPGGPLREIKCLDSCHHPYVLDLKEVVLPPEAQGEGQQDPLTCIYIVTELAERDLSALLHSMPSPFDEPRARQLMRLLHRDIKTANLLLTWQGTLKIADFGLCRPLDERPGGCYTNPVVTLWYRAPELLMGTDHYSTPIDIWSVGCVMAELFAKEPLFTGRTEVEQLCRIFDIFGLPDDRSWPGFTSLPGADIPMMNSDTWPARNLLRHKFSHLSPDAFRLLTMLLTCNPSQRITAEEALRHPWFTRS